MASWELVWTGQQAKPCLAGSWSELVNQLSHVELGAGLNWSTSWTMSSWELVCIDQPAESCQAGSWSVLINQLNHVKLGAGLYWSISWTMSSWELVCIGQPAEPCQPGSWSVLVYQLNHVELGAGLNRSTSWTIWSWELVCTGRPVTRYLPGGSYFFSGLKQCSSQTSRGVHHSLKLEAGVWPLTPLLHLLLSLSVSIKLSEQSKNIKDRGIADCLLFLGLSRDLCVMAPPHTHLLCSSQTPRG